MSSAADYTVEEFRAALEKHLAAAKRAIPDRVPDDVFDPCVGPLMNELHALDELLYELGYEKRRAEEAEQGRARRTAANQHAPGLESLVMRVDACIQDVVEVSAPMPGRAILLPLRVDLLISGVLRFLAALPDDAFASTRPALNEDRDPTIGEIVAIVRRRRAIEERP